MDSRRPEKRALAVALKALLLAVEPPLVAPSVGSWVPVELGFDGLLATSAFSSAFFALSPSIVPIHPGRTAHIMSTR